MSVLFKVVFLQHDELHEVYARSVSESSMMHFVEVEALVLDAPASSESGSPTQSKAQARLRSTYADVQRIYLPIQTILRIEEVHHVGTANIHSIEPAAQEANVTQILQTDATWDED